MSRVYVAAIVFAVLSAACSTAADTIEGVESTTTSDPATVTTSTASASGTTSSTTTSVAESSDGTREDPVQGGDFARVGDWNVRVIEVTPDATALVLAENQFNTEPVEGNQFFLATLEAEYDGETSGTFWGDVSWKALGPSSVAYDAFDATCGVTPNDIVNAGEAFAGGVITGTVCWSVSSNDVGDLVMFLEPTFAFSSDRTFFALDASMGAVAPTPPASIDLTGFSAAGVGEPKQVGDWTIRVTEVMTDATDLVLAENQFNDQPAEGRQFVMASIEAEYVGVESSTFWVDLGWKAVGPSAVAYGAFADSCGVIPDSITDAGEVFPGGVISGNVCWSVTEADADDLLMFVEVSFSFDETRTFFGLTGP